jgi:hypothetical protein
MNAEIDLVEAYNQANLGTDCPDEIYTTAKGLRFMAERLDKDGLLGYVKFADELPAGHCILLSKEGLSYVNVGNL